MSNLLPPPPKPSSPPRMPISKPPGLSVSSGGKTAVSHIPKTFSIQPWATAGQGEKFVIYGKSGVGKTTLAAMSPNPVFIGLDDGGRKITNPITGQPLPTIAGIDGFQDLRDALHQRDLWDAGGGQTIVIDTITKLESVAEPYIFANYPAKSGKAKAMRDYGWDGPAHLLDCFRLLLTDLDAHIRAGRNVILLAQMAPATIANAEGLDYLEDGPKLQHNKQYSVRSEVCEWADHVIRVGYLEFNVTRDDAKQKAGKVQSTDATRAVFTGGAQHFIAKSRPINGYRIPTAIGFSAPNDKSLWSFVFEGAREA